MGVPRVVLFDIDGTLITSGGAGGRAWHEAFRLCFGVTADIHAFTEVGMTDPEVAKKTFTGTLGRTPSTDELATLVMGYVKALPEQIETSAGYRVLPGVVHLLESLAAKGALLGVVTGNIEGAARIKIARGGLDRYFAFGGYGSDSAHRGELTRKAIERAGIIHGHAIDPAQVFVVGDTRRDIEAAEYAGAISVAVATGEYSEEELRRAHPDHVLPTLEAPFPTA